MTKKIVTATHCKGRHTEKKRGREREISHHLPNEYRFDVICNHIIYNKFEAIHLIITLLGIPKHYESTNTV